MTTLAVVVLGGLLGLWLARRQRAVERAPWRLVRGERVIATGATVLELRRRYMLAGAGVEVWGPHGGRYLWCNAHVRLEAIDRACDYDARRRSMARVPRYKLR